MLNSFTSLNLFIYPILSLLVFVSICWLFSENRKHINFFSVGVCFFWQLIFAFLLCNVPSVSAVLMHVNDGLQSINQSTAKAVAFCFGDLANPQSKSGLGFILALQGLPILIVISALSSLLIYWRILPIIIKFLSKFFEKTIRVGGTLGISISANVFTGMSETPLIVKPYLAKFTHNELFTLMVCGAAGTAGSVMVIYSAILGDSIPNSISHIIAASVINIPAAVGLARILVPEKKGQRHTQGDDANFSAAKSTLDAIYTGIVDGAKVIVNIIIMIIGFVALIDILNTLLGLLPNFDGEPFSLQRILGWVVAPLSFLIGIPWAESSTAGAIIGTKIIMNELVGFKQFVQDAHMLSERTKMIVMYALCGFANIGSIGIMIGIYGSLIPDRREEVINLGVKAILAGTFSNCLTASIVGALLFV